MFTPNDLVANLAAKKANEDPLKKELEEAFNIKLVTPGEAPAKKPFVRKPHLTDRPLRDNAELLELKKKLTTPTKPKTNRNRRTIKK